jgi:hypothetical protein
LSGNETFSKEINPEVVALAEEKQDIKGVCL